MRWAIAALVFLSLASPVQAQDRFYRQAQAEFAQLKVEDRLFFQLMMTAAGFWPAVPNESYSTRLHAAVKEFQSSLRQPPTGYITGAQIDTLAAQSTPVIRSWGFRSVRHPDRGHAIWIPMGFEMLAERTDAGVFMRDPLNRLRLSYEFFSGGDVRLGHAALLREMTASGDTILYEVLRDDFFVISSTQNGYHRYVRFHRDGGGLIGIDVSWRSNDAPIYGDRLVSVISGSLWASMTGAAFLKVDPIGYPWEAPEVAGSPAPARPSAPTSTIPKNTPSDRDMSSGTGFFVSRQGHVVTNEHVIRDCSRIAVRVGGATIRGGTILATNAADDLALIRIDHRPQAVAGLRVGFRLGEAVAVFGFPLADMLSSSGNFTLGNITALSGLNDDPRHLQVSAPVQQGNSGGPLVDEYGNVIGVVTYKLNALRQAAAHGDIPQNVNFAVKSTVLSTFLDANSIAYEPGGRTEPLRPADLAERAGEISVHVVCD